MGRQVNLERTAQPKCPRWPDPVDVPQVRFFMNNDGALLLRKFLQLGVAADFRKSSLVALVVGVCVACSGASTQSTTAKTPLEQAIALRDSGKLADAEAQLAVLAEAGDAAAQLELAETLMLSGKHAKAAALLKDRWKINPNDAVLADIMARALDGAGEPDEAAPVYAKRLQLHPNDLAAALRLADLLVGRGDLVGACMIAEEALRQHPGHAGLHTVLSRALVGRGRLPQALEHAKLATNYAPDDPQSWLQLAQVQILTGDLEAGKASLERCVKIDPQNIDALRDLGVVMLEVGDVKQAVALLKRATQVAPDSAAAWTALGVARHRAGDLVGATAALEHAARKQPHAAVIYANLAEVALDDGFPRRAVTESRKARDRLGSTASANFRKRIEKLHVRAVVVSLVADALCRGDKDSEALQKTAEHELHDAGLQAYLGDIVAVGADATVQIRAAQSRCGNRAIPTTDERRPTP